MRLLYTSDLHGNSEAYVALLALAADQGVEAAIVGGDLLPPTLALQTAIGRQRAFVGEVLRPILQEFRRAHPLVALYLLPGNDDWAAAIAALNDLESEELAHPLHQHVYPLRANAERPAATARFLAGYACVPITPFSIKDFERRDDGPLPPYSFAMAFRSHPTLLEPRRVSGSDLAADPSIADELAALATHSPAAQTVYVCHAPPHATALDQAYQGKHIGSVAIRHFIEQHQPPLTLHGHAHESPALSGRYAEQIGATWCINPGHDGRQFHAIVVDTDDIAGTLWHTVYGKYTV